MESASIPAGNVPEAGAAGGDKGLKTGAIGYLSNLVIGVASTAPAYSLAVTLGFITAIAGMGFHAPAVMIVSFIPMLLIAAAYNYMNKADPDCGTSFTWVTRALGPRLGWLTGWTIVAADVLVMATLAYIAARLLVPALRPRRRLGQPARHQHRRRGLDRRHDLDLLHRHRDLRPDPVLPARHRDLHPRPVRRRRPLEGVRDRHPGLGSRRAQLVLPLRAPRRNHRPGRRGAARASSSTGAGTAASASTRSRRTAANGPGKAAVMSTILLVLIYVVVAAAAQAFHGPSFLSNNSEDVLGALGGKRPRLAAGQTADHHGADLGLGVDPDDDPADGADDALDGALRLDPEVLRPDPPALPDSGRLDARDGRPLADLDPVHHQRQHQRPRRRDHRPRLPDRLLLRADRVRLRGLLPQGDLQERQKLHHGRRGPIPRRRDAHLHLHQGASSPTRTRPKRKPAPNSSASASRWRSASG